MEFRIPFGTGRAAIPVSLAMRSGERVGGLLPGVDAASALVIAQGVDGSYSQSFHPLNVRLHPIGSDPGDTEWALHGLRIGSTTWVYFLGVPAAFTGSEGPAGKALRSLDIQIVGHSVFRSEGSFAGHATLAFGPAEDTYLLPRFQRFADQWLPVLLSERFVAAAAMTQVEDDGPQPVLAIALAKPEDEAPIPPALREDWDPAGWNDAVIEPVGAAAAGHFLIRGGCFVTAEGRISHWFGGRIGLERRGFRAQASEQLLRVVPRGSAHWCFWVESEGNPPQPDFSAARGGVRVRHPAMGLAWNGAARAAGEAVALPDYRAGVEMLRDAAKLLADRHQDWERLRGEASWQQWQKPFDRAAPPADWLETLRQETARFYFQYGPLMARLATVMLSPSPDASALSNPFALLAEFAAVAYRNKEAPR